MLQGVPGVIVYIYDILVSGKDKHEKLDTVFRQIEEAGLKLKC